MVSFDPHDWLAVDPDPDTRAELTALIENGGVDLDARFDGRLEFGTAGIRGELGAGPQRMNRVLVRMVAAALGSVLEPAAGEPATVIIGHDARYKSADFADDTARVLASMGVRARLIDGVQPTPLVAYAVLATGAAAGVMVTASHNPAADNGYKVYWNDGVQIVPPIDAAISGAIDDAGLVDPARLVDLDHPLIEHLGADLEAAFVTSRVGLAAADGPRDLSVVYTPMHGVGAPLVERVMTGAGFDPPSVVEAQRAPDPTFPTVAFPNPEEPGALDLALELAADVNADVVFANDPDADRLAVAVPDVDGWRQLSGNEVGVLLGDHLLQRTPSTRPLVVTTVVSSRMLGRIAAAHGADFEETLTGFKWVMRPALERPDHDFVFGYEEALGYAVDTDVLDKDGIAAMVVFAELAASLKAQGLTVVDRLHDLYERHGVHRTGQRSVRLTGLTLTQAEMMARLRASPPDRIAERSVLAVVDLEATTDFPVTTNALVFELDGDARLVVRPSGTEPKVKLYAEIVLHAGSSVRDAEREGDDQVESLLTEGEHALLS